MDNEHAGAAAPVSAEEYARAMEEENRQRYFYATQKEQERHKKGIEARRNAPQRERQGQVYIGIW
jgi:hypothetical protein